jgi:hypothetical protein
MFNDFKKTRTSFIINLTICTLIVGSPLAAETYECIFPKRSHPKVLSENIIIDVNSSNQRVLVKDKLVKKLLGTSVQVARILTKNEKRTTFGWELPSQPWVRHQFDGQGVGISFLTYKLTIYSKSNKALLTLPLPGYFGGKYNIRGTGTCSVSK